MKIATNLALSLLLVFSISFAKAQTTITSYIFGHSLLDHRPPLIPTPSDETTVAHWMYLLSNEAGHNYSVGGQYGFLPQHANLPPNAQWGYDIVPGAWDSDFETFAEADFNHIMITAGNFMQWQAPNLPYPTDPNLSPISATQDIVDWLSLQESGLKIYIYENWPDMAPYISGGSFPPSASDFQNYNNYTRGAFHDWWLEYHDSLLLSHPVENVRMIPVGPILSDLFENTVLNQIPLTELYEDDAPHGRATTYFLASLITYMATYEEKAPSSYVVPNIVHATVRNNYSTVVDFIWNELLDFNLPNGESRVFFNTVLPVELTSFEAFPQENGVALKWQTLTETNNEKFEIEHSTDGYNFAKIGEIQGHHTSFTPHSYTFLHRSITENLNYYRLKQIDLDQSFEYSKTISVQFDHPLNPTIKFFPNPSTTGYFNLIYTSIQEDNLDIIVTDISGKVLRQERHSITQGSNPIAFDFSLLGQGVFIVKLRQGQQQSYHKIILN